MIALDAIILHICIIQMETLAAHDVNRYALLELVKISSNIILGSLRMYLYIYWLWGKKMVNLTRIIVIFHANYKSLLFYKPAIVAI